MTSIISALRRLTEPDPAAIERGLIPTRIGWFTWEYRHPRALCEVCGWPMAVSTLRAAATGQIAHVECISPISVDDAATMDMVDLTGGVRSA